MKDRLRKLRRTLDLTQTEFASKIGTTQNVIANYEAGRRNPSGAVINNICKTFSVNEEWLRTGNGVMFVERDESEEITAMVNEIMADKPDDFRRRFIAALSRLDMDAWKAIEAFALSIVEGRDERPHDELDIEAEVAAYRAHLLREKEAREKSSASGATG